MTESKQTLNTVVNLAVLAFVGFAAFGPRGFFRSGREARAAEREQRVAIARLWNDLTNGQQSEAGVLVEFTDYQCPYCKDMHPVVAGIAEEGVTVVTRHFPITIAHPKAESAARAAICAEEQGRLQDLHDRLFGHSGWYTAPEPWLEEASAAGLPDVEAFEECLASERTTGRLARDQDLARQLGIRSTPTYVGKAGLHRGVGSRSDLMELIR